MAEQTETTAPQWYINHFTRFGHTADELKRTWARLPEEARVGYRAALAPELADDASTPATPLPEQSQESLSNPTVDAASALVSRHDAEVVLSGADYDASTLFDHLERSGDNLLNRVAFILHNRDGSGVTAFSRSAEMEDWEEFEDYAANFDAAVVIPSSTLDAYPVTHRDLASMLPVYDFSAIAETINQANTVTR